MPIACGTSELWHGLQVIVAVSLGEAKELPMPLRRSWDLCRLQDRWLCSGCWGAPSQGGRWGAADSWDLRDMLVTGKTEEMVIWEEILGLFCFDSWLDMGWSESDQGEVHTVELQLLWLNGKGDQGEKQIKMEKIWQISKITHPSCKSFLFSVTSTSGGIQAKLWREGKLQHY